jgi:diadenosine tetraphosphate (Ap4A) HIT family hydrolase
MMRRSSSKRLAFLGLHRLLPISRNARQSLLVPSQEIVKNGQAIAICNGSAPIIEKWVKKVAMDTQTNLDWGYRMGYYAYIYCLGDESERQRACAELQKPEPGIRRVKIIEKRDGDCLFCRKYFFRVYESKHFYAIYDDYPVRRGHMLLIPIRHVEDLTLLTEAEVDDCFFFLLEMIMHIKQEFGADGYNVGINGGEAAGQTVPHLHIHIIPRHFGDVPNPRGGIRKFLPNPLKDYPES